MKNKILLILGLLTILFLIGLALYCILNLKWQMGREESSLTNLGNSPLVKQIVVNIQGEVSKISGRTLTVTTQGKSLDVLVRTDADVASFTAVSSTSSISVITDETKISFEDIKLKDKVNIFAELKADGNLESKNVAVLFNPTIVTTTTSATPAE
ncbi:MAG: hypothetical protein V1833_01940 [Elusimicrobiota bacterium]